MKLMVEQVHQIKVDTLIDWPELEQIIADAVHLVAAAQWVGATYPHPPLKIEIEQCKEGSPEYSVRKWRARVSGVKALENSNGA